MLTIATQIDGAPVVDPIQMLTTSMFKTVLDLRDETNIMFMDPERLRLFGSADEDTVGSAVRSAFLSNLSRNYKDNMYESLSIQPYERSRKRSGLYSQWQLGPTLIVFRSVKRSKTECPRTGLKYWAKNFSDRQQRLSSRQTSLLQEPEQLVMVGLDVHDVWTGEPGEPPRSVTIRELILAVPAVFKGHTVQEWAYGSGYVVHQTSEFRKSDPKGIPVRIV